MAVPRFSRTDINGMRDQLLSMNLDCEGLDSTGSETEKRIRLLEHFYPTRDEALSQAPVAGVSRYTVDQVKSLLVEPLRSISTELGLPILNSETNFLSKNSHYLRVCFFVCLYLTDKTH